MARVSDYDVVVTTIENDNIHALERIVNNKKVDGVIVTRALVHDPAIKFLKKSGIPFVMIGSVDDDSIYQVDTDNFSGCRELTAYLGMICMQKIALIGGNQNHRVTMDRYKGYEEGLKLIGRELDDRFVFLDIQTDSAIQKTLKELLKRRPGCIICMDDFLCGRVLGQLSEMHIQVPKDIMVASFYETGDETFQGTDVISLRYDPGAVGVEAGKVLLGLIEGETVSRNSKLGYEIVMRKSMTK